MSRASAKKVQVAPIPPNYINKDYISDTVDKLVTEFNNGTDADLFQTILVSNVYSGLVDAPKDMVPGNYFGNLDGKRKENLCSSIGQVVGISPPNISTLTDFLKKGNDNATFNPVNRNQTHYIRELLEKKSAQFPQTELSTLYAHKLDVPRVTATTGYNPRLTNLYVSYDNSTKDIVANPRYIATLGTVGDPSTRDWNNITFLTAAPSKRQDIGHVYETLPMKYVIQAGLGHIINKPPTIAYDNDKNRNGWTITIPTVEGDIEGKFNEKVDPIDAKEEEDSHMFRGNNEKNQTISKLINDSRKITTCMKYLLVKIIGDLFQVMCLRYLFDREEERSKTEPGFTLKYHEGNTVITTSDIIVLYRSWINNVPVIHTDQMGVSTLWMPNVQTDASLINITKDMIDCIVTEVIGHNMSVINTFQAVIDSAPIPPTVEEKEALARLEEEAAKARGSWNSLFRPSRPKRQPATDVTWLQCTWGKPAIAAAINYLNGMIAKLVQFNTNLAGQFAELKDSVTKNVRDNNLNGVKELASKSHFINPFSRKEGQAAYTRNPGIVNLLPKGNPPIKFSLSSTMKIGGGPTQAEILNKMGLPSLTPVDTTGNGKAVRVGKALARAISRNNRFEGVLDEEDHAQAAPAQAQEEKKDEEIQSLLTPLLVAKNKAFVNDRDRVKYAVGELPMEWLINVNYLGESVEEIRNYIRNTIHIDRKTRMYQQRFYDRTAVSSKNIPNPPNPLDFDIRDEPFNEDSLHHLLKQINDIVASQPRVNNFEEILCKAVTAYLTAVAKESIRTEVDASIDNKPEQVVNEAGIIANVRARVSKAIDAIRTIQGINEFDINACAQEALNTNTSKNIASIIQNEKTYLENNNKMAEILADIGDVDTEEIMSEEAAEQAEHTERAARAAQAAARAAQAAAAPAALPEISRGLLAIDEESAFIFIYIREFHPEVFTLANCMAIGLGFNARISTKDIVDFESIDSIGTYSVNKYLLENSYHLSNEVEFTDANQNKEYRRFLNNSTHLAIKYTKFIIKFYPHIGTSALKEILNLYRKQPFAINMRVSPNQETLGVAANFTTTQSALAMALHGGGSNTISDEELHKRLPQAVEIAIHIYEIIYALTIKASYLHKKIYELVPDLQEYIDNYDLSISELTELPEFPEQTRLLEVARYEQQMLRDVLLPRFQAQAASAVTVPVSMPNATTITVPVKMPVKMPVTTKLNTKSNTKSSRKVTNPLTNTRRNMATAAAAGGFKKTRKNNKIKKLKKSYTKSRRALKQSRKHT